MKVIVNDLIDMNIHGKKSSCKVHCVHIIVQNIKLHAHEIINAIRDTSWINSLDAIDQISYEARATKTIIKLVDSIFSKVEDEVTEEFGEYLVTYVAQEMLANTHKHGKVPWAELFKEKLSNNMGFDFHTESTNQIIVFGESKFSSRDNPYTNAITQINDFINEKKDLAELVHVRKFVSVEATDNATGNKKGFVAAFSLNSGNPAAILKNAVTSGHLDSLLCFSELYLIGVQIDVKISN